MAIKMIVAMTGEIAFLPFPRRFDLSVCIQTNRAHRLYIEFCSLQRGPKRFLLHR
jgi:hypothetical protein